MTALPVPPASLPMTAEAYAALPEDGEVRFELQEGALVMSPRPAPRHQDFLGGLYVELRRQAPEHLKVLQEVDVDLQLTPAGGPATIRTPDLVVVSRTAFERVDAAGGLLAASDVLLAVEILSPSSVRLDSIVKREEYADAGIARYWIVEIDRRPWLTAHFLAGEFGYGDDGPENGTFTADEPFPIQLDLDKLS